MSMELIYTEFLIAGNIACSRGKHWNVPTGLSVIDSTAKQETRIQSSLSD